jgi:ketosteroid isomerase-like protein
VHERPDGRTPSETEEEMSEQNKTLARRWFEDLFSRGDLDAANEILSAEFVDHLPREEERGIEELKHYVSIYRTAFPDIQDTVEEMVAEGDKVVVRCGEVTVPTRVSSWASHQLADT